jgi:hypothetical protein
MLKTSPLVKNSNKVYFAKTNDVFSSVIFDNSDGKKICVEDGMVDYLGKSNNRNKSTFKSVAKKTFYFSRNVDKDLRNEADLFDEIMVTHKYSSRYSKYSHVKIDKIYPPTNVEYLRNFFNEKFQINERLKRASHLFLPPHSSIVTQSSSLVEVFNEELEKYSESGTTVAVKYHPREVNKYLDIDVVEVPQQVPIELLYLSSTNLTTVIGLMSTALKSALWLREDITSLSVYEKIFSEDKTSYLLKNIGINMTR